MITNKQKGYKYEVRYTRSAIDSVENLATKILTKIGRDKVIKTADLNITQQSGLCVHNLSTKTSSQNVKAYLKDVGLDKESETHYTIRALSGEQKVKMAIAAALWNVAHILILDKPTNYILVSRPLQRRGKARMGTGKD